VPEVAHSGSTAGYRAYLARYPRQGIGVAVLCNHGGANATALARGVAEAYLGAALAPRSAPAAAASLPAARVETIVGRYRDPRTGEVVTLVADSGRARIRGGPLMVPIDARRFVVGTDTVVFGATRGPFLVVDEMGDSVRFEPQPAFAPTAAQLAEYAGTYASDEADGSLVVDVHEGAIRVRLADGRPLGRLTPAFPDAFDGAGTVRFVRDGTGRVTALSFREDRVWDLRFVRR
jgi:hypothetical protein